jgi:hypothetical protein
MRLRMEYASTIVENGFAIGLGLMVLLLWGVIRFHLGPGTRVGESASAEFGADDAGDGGDGGGD